MNDALLILDMQQDLLAEDGAFPVDQGQVELLIAATNEVVAKGRGRDVGVVTIVNAFSPWDPGNLFRHGCCVRGRAGSELDPRVHPGADSPVFTKWRSDAFCNHELLAWLRRREVERLAVAGVYADACVLATVRGALRRGFEVTVLEDAVAARDAEAVARGLKKMEQAGATITTVECWLADEEVEDDVEAL